MSLCIPTLEPVNLAPSLISWAFETSAYLGSEPQLLVELLPQCLADRHGPDLHLRCALWRGEVDLWEVPFGSTRPPWDCKRTSYMPHPCRPGPAGELFVAQALVPVQSP